MTFAAGGTGRTRCQRAVETIIPLAHLFPLPDTLSPTGHDRPRTGPLPHGGCPPRRAPTAHPVTGHTHARLHPTGRCAFAEQRPSWRPANVSLRGEFCVFRSALQEPLRLSAVADDGEYRHALSQLRHFKASALSNQRSINSVHGVRVGGNCPGFWSDG